MPCPRHWQGFALLCMAAVLFGPGHINARSLGANAYCSGMSLAAAGQACMDHATAATAQDRICKAMAWKVADLSSYYCSGINDACLAAESRLGHGRAVVRVCSPLPEGAVCGSRLLAASEPRCVKGMCVDKFGLKVVAPVLPVNPVPSAARLAGTAQIQQLKSRVVQAKGQKAGSAATFEESITVSIDTLRLGSTIPHGFLGISMEWQGIQYYGRNAEAWGRLLSVLGPGGIIRVGGASQDKLTEAPGDESWEAMSALHRAAGIGFIIGLPLNGNNESLITGMMTRARQILPTAALVGFELGNEPTYWGCPGMGGWDAQGVFQPGWAPYAAYFDRMARKISRCDKAGMGEKNIIGPGWDNLNTFPTSRSSEVLQRSSCYLQDLSVHYYPYYSKNAFNAHSLLSEDLAREAARNATLHVRAAAAFNQAVRITEANSLSGAGEEGTSDAFAAALWTADIAFEFAAAGVKSMHFHWGVGGVPDDSVIGGGGVPVYAGIRTYHLEDGTTAPQTRAPWFGYLLFQAAVSPKAAEAYKLGPSIADGKPGHLATVTSALATPACSKGQIKVWPIMHQASKPGRSELRVVILNKSDKEDCVVNLELNDAYGDALITRVMPDESQGRDRLASKYIRYGGASYTDMSGAINGTPQGRVVQARQHTVVPAGKQQLQRAGTSYSFHMPKASAALLVAADQEEVQ